MLLIRGLFLLCLPIACALVAGQAPEPAVSDGAPSVSTEQPAPKRLKRAARTKKASIFYQPGKRISKMEYAELCEWLAHARTGTDHNLTLKLIDQALQKRPDCSVVQELLLERANLLYTMQRFSEAAQTYEKFYALYPRCTQSEYALYRAIACSEQLILDFEHDQTQTYATIKLADTFLECEIFTQQRVEVEHMRARCYEKLFAYEAGICRFHMLQKNFMAADTRLAAIAETYKEKPVANLTEQLTTLGTELVAAMQANGVTIVASTAPQKMPETVASAMQEKPATETAQKVEVAQQKTPAKPFVDRF